MSFLQYRALQKNPDQWVSNHKKKESDMLFFFIFIFNFEVQSTLKKLIWIHRNSIWKT